MRQHRDLHCAPVPTRAALYYPYLYRTVLLACRARPVATLAPPRFMPVPHGGTLFEERCNSFLCILVVLSRKGTRSIDWNIRQNYFLPLAANLYALLLKRLHMHHPSPRQTTNQKKKACYLVRVKNRRAKLSGAKHLSVKDTFTKSCSCCGFICNFCCQC
jgi:hypothetical protein